MMTKWLSLAAIVTLCLALVMGVACGGGGAGEERVTKLKFGAALPLSGAAGAVIGVPAKNSVEIMNEFIGEFEVGGKLYRWDLIFEDNKFSGEGGVATSTKFISEYGVDLIMHQNGVDAGVSSYPYAEAKDIIVDTAGGNYELFTPERPLLFQVAASYDLSFTPFFDWFMKEHPEVKSVVAINVDNATGVNIDKGVKKCCEYYGLEFHEILYPIETTELYPLGTKAMTYDPDLVVGFPTVLAPMWDMGYKGFAVSYYWMEASAESVGWDRCVGFFIAGPHAYADAFPAADPVKEEYERRYNAPFGAPQFFMANILYVYTEALKKAGTVDDVDKIIETLETETFDSLCGPVFFGLEELNGIGHICIWPVPIFRVVGENEYEIITRYTAEEVEALTLEIYGK